MHNKNVKNNIIAGIALFLLTGVLVFFYIQLNTMEKKALAIQESAVNNSQTISTIVNFFNSNLGQQQ